MAIASCFQLQHFNADEGMECVIACSGMPGMKFLINNRFKRPASGKKCSAVTPVWSKKCVVGGGCLCRSAGVGCMHGEPRTLESAPALDPFKRLRLSLGP